MWCERFTFNGHRVAVYGKTRAECREKMMHYQETHGDTFSSVASLWWDAKSHELSVTTVRSYERPLDRAITHFGERRIADIRPCDISAYMEAEIARHKMARNTASNALTVVRQIFGFAVEKGIVDTNPAREVKLPRNLKKSRRTLPEDSDLVLIEAHPEGFGLFYLIAAYTGLRKGEILALTWNDIKGGLISVTKSVAYQGNTPIIKEPKTENSVRVVPVPDALAVHLHRGKGYIFGGDAPLTARQFQNRENAYRKETGIHCTAHQLRHAYASLLDESNISVKEAQSLLGHAQASTTEDIYQDIREARRKKIASKVSRLSYNCHTESE